MPLQTLHVERTIQILFAVLHTQWCHKQDRLIQDSSGQCMHAFNHIVRYLKVLCILLPPFNKTLLGETVTSCNATFMAYWSGQAVCYCVKPTFHIYNNRLFFCQLWFNDMTSVAHGSLVEPVFINTTHGERQNYMQNRKKELKRVIHTNAKY